MTGQEFRRSATEQSLARTIFDRMADGATLDEVEAFITEATQPATPAPAPRVVDPGAEEETDWGFKWNEKGW